MLRHIPNILTVSRILAIPFVVAALYIGPPLGNWLALAVFVIAAVTDYLDGYLARIWKQQSALGRFLDPIADKLLVAAVILMLVGIGTISGVNLLAAVVILMREILVSGLREFLAEIKIGVPVTRLAKWKTTIQLVALGFLIVGGAGPHFGPLSTTAIGLAGLWGAAALTLVTGYDYLRAGLRHLALADGRKEEKPVAE
jgi:cardiolipin synthase